MDLQPVLEQRAKVEEFRRKHRIGLLTLLFTDLVGSTKLKQELGDQQAVVLLQRHHALVREILSRFKESEEIETAGDSFFIVFAKPSDAVRFSLMLQNQLRALAPDVPRQLIDRIGIHIGEVVIEEHEGPGKQKDLYGLQVDICARVMSLAEGDQILMTRSVFDNARQVLKGQEIEGIPDLSWLNHGPYLLKGVEEPLEICEVGEAGAAILKPPSDSEKVNRYVSADAEPVLGWRPALGQGVPGTSWVLEEKLGEGGFGEVWLGRHKTTKDRRVFKFCFRADRVRSLRREVTLFRVLKERVGEHPNVVQLREVFFDEPPFYIEMEYVKGRDLKTWIEAQGGFDRVPLETRLEIVAQVADALQAAHDAGVIHRDVKPSNILISDFSEPNCQPQIKNQELTVKLTDFGIGQVIAQEVLTGVTRLGFTETVLGSGRETQAGTFLYMAPELLAGKPASKQSDVYSLGVVLYQLLVGDLSQTITTDWSNKIGDAVLREDLAICTAGNPADRFPGAVELAENLRNWDRRRLARELEEVRAQAEREEHQRKLAEKHACELQAAYAKVSETVTRLQIQRAEEMFAAGDSDTGLAYLARILRKDPNNRVAAARLLSDLSFREIVLPVGPPLQHGGSVRSAEFSPDGQRIVTASNDKTARIWNAQTGQPVAPPLEHDDVVRSAQFSPDGQCVLTGSPDCTARLWDVGSGQPIFPPLQHAWPVFAAWFSWDGRRIVTASKMTARVWDARNGQPISPILQHEAPVRMAQFSPNGERLLSVSCDNEHCHLCEWDLQTNKRLRSVRLDHEKLVVEARFSPDGQRLVTRSNDQFARMWDARTGRPITPPLKHNSLVRSVEISPDGQRVLTTSTDGSAQMWDARTGEPIGPALEQHEDLIYCGHFSQDGLRVLTASHDKTARVGDIRTGQCTSFKFDGPVTCASFSPDGQRIVAGSNDNSARIWSARKAHPKPLPLVHQTEVTCAEFSPDGQLIATVSPDKTVRIWDTKTGRIVLGPLAQEDYPLAARFSSDGQRLLVACTGFVLSGHANIINVRTGQSATPPLKHSSGLSSALFSPDGKKVATASWDGTAQVWDAQSGSPIGPALFHADSTVWSACFSPDGLRVATACGRHDKSGGYAQIWNAENGQPLSPPLNHSDWVKSVEFSPDGNWVLSASEDRTARVWDAGTGQPISASLRHEDSLWSARFSPDGRRVLTASNDKTARLWHADTGLPAGPSLKHQGAVVFADFSPGGERIVTAAMDKTTRLWDAETGQPISAPLPGGGRPNFSADGQRLVMAAPDSIARIWEVPIASGPVPAWAVHWAEAIAGKRLDDDDISEPVSPDELLTVQQQLFESVDADVWTRCARWHFADRASKTISPFSPFSISDYVQHCIERNTVADLQEAILLEPSNGLAFAKLARKILDEENNPRRVGEAAFLIRHALQLAQENEEVQRISEEIKTLGSRQSLTNGNSIAEPLAGALEPPLPDAPWKVPPDSDPIKILDEARSDTLAGHYAEALAKHAWFHENALKLNEAMSEVRLSIALDDWMNLASFYPAALEKLRQVRDKAAQKVREEQERRLAFLELAALNEVLGDPINTKDAFVWLHKNEPTAAKSAFDFAWRALFDAGEHELCRAYFDFDEEFRKISQRYRQAAAARENLQPPSQGQPEVSIPNPSMITEIQREFRANVEILVSCAAFYGGQAEGNRIAAQALEELNDPQFREDLERATAELSTGPASVRDMILETVAQSAPEALWQPPPKPDLNKILEEARSDTAAGRYAQALAKHVWFHENALTLNESFYGVRLSYALADWMKLASLYPEALKKLRQIRDNAESAVRDAAEPRQIFHDAVSLNEVLGEPSRTRDLFAWLHQNKPGAAKSVYDLAERALVDSGEFRLCGAYLDPDSSFQGWVQAYHARFKQFEDLPFPKPHPAGFPESMKQEMLKFAKHQFCYNVSMLIALLTLNERADDAERIANAALRECDDPDFRQAVERARRDGVPPPRPGEG